jgi:hypothetical protein
MVMTVAALVFEERHDHRIAADRARSHVESEPV